MALRTGFLMLASAACIWPVHGQDQTTGSADKPGAASSAREMFLNPRQMPYSVQDETPAPAKSQSSVKPKPKPKPADAAAASQASSGRPATERPANIIPASFTALALRYTVQKIDGGQTTDVPANTEFHSKDRIRLSVEVNDTGYLYIVNQGTSGTWKAMFPSPEIEDGDNGVQRGHVYTVPPGHKFTFSGAPGVERLFVIFSRQPVQEIDSLIYSLKGGQPAPPAGAHAVLTASAGPIADGEIAQMRATYSRDLIIEKGDQEQDGGQQQASPKQDKSVYVANPKGSPDSRVVADIPLIHK